MDIPNTEVLSMFYSFIVERHNIWYRRYIEHRPYPWTDDEILKTYRFTNVYRVLDTGTRYVLSDILSRKSDNLEKLFNIILYRIFNRIQTFEYMGYQNFNDFDGEVFEDKLKEYRADGNQVFTGAFYVTGHIHLDTPDKIEKYCRCIRSIHQVLPTLWDVAKHKDMQGFHYDMTQLSGIGKFLAYQIMLDAMYDRVLPYTENEWSFAFLGCARGLKYIFPELDMNNDTKCLESMRYLQEHQKEYLEPLDFHSLGAYELANGYIYDGTSISLSNIENCLCEFSKYMKAKLGVGRPKVLYKPKNSEISGKNLSLLRF